MRSINTNEYDGDKVVEWFTDDDFDRRVSVGGYIEVVCGVDPLRVVCGTLSDVGDVSFSVRPLGCVGVFVWVCVSDVVDVHCSEDYGPGCHFGRVMSAVRELRSSYGEALDAVLS